MTSKIKHLQFVRLYLSTHVTNTKSMTPNQLRHRASGFKGFRHTPLGPCSGFKAKCHDFIFLFLLFFFFFFSFLEDNIGLQLWVTPFFQSLSLDPPEIMEELYRWADKYSMLEDNVHAATQTVMITSQLAKGHKPSESKEG